MSRASDVAGAAGLVLGLLLAAAPARAQSSDPVAELQACFDDLRVPQILDGRPVESPTVGPYYGLRLMGMGGAFTAVAEGIEAVPYTLTALANRRPHQGGWFDWDATLTWLVPTNLQDVDYNGCPTRGSVRLVAAGGLLRFGRVGAGVFIDQVAFPSLGDRALSLTVLRSTAGVAWALPGDAWVVGVGLHTLAYDLTTATRGLGALALGAGANVLWRPTGRRWRLGLSMRLPQAARVVPDSGTLTADLPEAVVEPWQFTLGGAWWIGEGALNQRMAVTENDEGSPPAIDGMLLTGDLMLVLPRKVNGRDAAGLEAFFEGRTQVVNPRPTVGLRVGTETEPIADRVRMRGGLWLEPSRFEGITPRLHVTGGIDVRIFELYGYDIRGSLAGDAAPGYGAASLSVGFW
ncbi:MAG: hypothetical protein P1V51_09750 [Deltaproteobacteria bacterium]|nr:hypothetical protein [Deltaproteobacteria bacterium]